MIVVAPTTRGILKLNDLKVIKEDIAFLLDTLNQLDQFELSHDCLFHRD